jgi:hypothetical protein
MDSFFELSSKAAGSLVMVQFVTALFIRWFCEMFLKFEKGGTNK